MPLFVLLEHDHPVPHLDFMIEGNGALLTWRLSKPPTGAAQPAVRIGDHRSAYLDYEGPVSGGRGAVRREDGGEYV